MEVQTYLVQKIMDHVIEKIKDGTYVLGSTIPPSSKLADDFLVSRPTVLKAISELRDRQIVKTYHGIGTIVLRIPTQRDKLSDLTGEVRKKMCEIDKLLTEIEKELKR